MKTVILLVALLAVASSTLVRSHQYWYTAEKALVKTGVPFADFAWNYCDLKCLYFEHYINATDFVYIDFSAGFFKPNFAACFIRTVLANGTANYALWNTDAVAANNTFYSTYCFYHTSSSSCTLCNISNNRYKSNNSESKTNE